MSLINDALKRAHNNQPGKGPAGGTPMRPTQTDAPSPIPQIVIPVGFLVILAMGGWFVMKGLEVARQATSTEDTISARESSLFQTPPVTEPVPTLPPSAPTETTTTTTATSPVPTVPPAVAATPAPPPEPPGPPSFPTLKLQAVFYNADNPAVVINNKTLEIGQRHKDVTVLSISRQSVMVQWQNETRELYLP